MRYGAYFASPLRCLLVEDQALIGMALEAYLEGAGYEVAGPFATSAAALGLSSGSVGTTGRRAESALRKELNRHASSD